MRHGARTPIIRIPGYDLINDDEVPWDCTEHPILATGHGVAGKVERLKGGCALGQV